MALLSSEMKTEDVTQGVSLKFWEQRAHLGRVASSKAYATRITHNKYIDILRAPVQRLRNAEEPTELEISLVTMTPQEDLIAQEQFTRISDWVATPPKQQQRVWRLRQEMTLTNDETVQRIGLQEVTVQSMVSRLRKEAQELFADIRE